MGEVKSYGGLLSRGTAYRGQVSARFAAPIYAMNGLE